MWRCICISICIKANCRSIKYVCIACIICDEYETILSTTTTEKSRTISKTGLAWPQTKPSLAVDRKTRPKKICYIPTCGPCNKSLRCIVDNMFCLIFMFSFIYIKCLLYTYDMPILLAIQLFVQVLTQRLIQFFKSGMYGRFCSFVYLHRI